MSHYFLVEGKRTEMALYPAWISALQPKIQRANSVSEVSSKGEYYYIFSDLGMPRLLDCALPSSIADVEANSAFSDLVVVVDSEGGCKKSLSEEINLRFEEYSTSNQIKLTVIVQDLCIESWLLGNKKIYSQAPQCQKLREYRSFYDCRTNDPEGMRCRPNSCPQGSIADFHFDYLRRVFREKCENYSKRNPGNADEIHYLNQIIERYNSGDIASFGSFLNWVPRLH